MVRLNGFTISCSLHGDLWISSGALGCGPGGIVLEIKAAATKK